MMDILTFLTIYPTAMQLTLEICIN